MILPATDCMYASEVRMMRYHIFLSIFAAALLALGLVTPTTAQQAMRHAGHSPSWSDGMPALPFNPATAKIDFVLQPIEGDAVVAGRQARAILRLTDSKSGLPVSASAVAGWMVLHRNSSGCRRNVVQAPRRGCSPKAG